MGPFIAKTIQKNSSPIGFCLIFWDCFTINFQPIAMICTFLERGASYLTTIKFHQNPTKTRDLCDHFIAKLFKTIRVREAFVRYFGIVLLSISNRLP